MKQTIMNVPQKRNRYVLVLLAVSQIGLKSLLNCPIISLHMRITLRMVRIRVKLFIAKIAA